MKNDFFDLPYVTHSLKNFPKHSGAGSETGIKNRKIPVPGSKSRYFRSSSNNDDPYLKDIIKKTAMKALVQSINRMNGGVQRTTGTTLGAVHYNFARGRVAALHAELVALAAMDTRTDAAKAQKRLQAQQVAHKYMTEIKSIK